MRFAGVGLLILGALLGCGALLGGSVAESLLVLTAGGFIFVAGAVFAASAGIQDAIKRRP